VVLFEQPGEKGQAGCAETRTQLGGNAIERSGIDQGLGGNEGPNSKTVPTITTQPITSSQSPWRIMAFKGMQPVP
jgi:hypothetical protein